MDTFVLDLLILCLLENTYLFSPEDYEKNDKIILKYFQQLKRSKICIALFVANIENLRNLNIIPLRKNINSFYYLQ